MKKIYPDYYKKFSCIADRCHHTCCEGWEIDIDEKSLKRYENIKGRLGEKLRDNIIKDECPHFKLTENERCPFLNSDNLCELILNLGENSLCQICSDHPRFRSCLNDRTEIGLGLCCEEAARLILTNKEKVTLIEESDGKETETDEFDEYVLNLRDDIFYILQDRRFTVDERVGFILKGFGISIPKKSFGEWADFFSSLERMDIKWDKELSLLKENDVVPSPLSQLEIPFEQLLVYFMYRHLPLSQDETDIKAQTAFGILAYEIIRALCLVKKSLKELTMEEFLEICRLYSSEIEYSEENTDEILNLLWEENDSN